MSDNKEGDEIVPKGNEWEVVALTESAYAAAPGPKPDILDQSNSNLTGEEEAETAEAMFMSGHFKFSPNTQKTLLVEPSSKETPVGMGSNLHGPDVMAIQGGKSDFKHEDDMHLEGLISEEFPGATNFDEKGGSGSMYISDFSDVSSSNLIEKESSIYSAVNIGAYDDEATAGRSYFTDENIGITEPLELVDHAADPFVPTELKPDEEDEHDELPSFPHEAWWKKHSNSLCDHVKNANPYWSIVVAAAVVGLVIIGHRWQRDKPKGFKLVSQLAINDKGSGWILGPMAQLKYATLGGQNSANFRASRATAL